MAAGRHLEFWYRSKMALEHVADCPCLPSCHFFDCTSTGGWVIAFCGKIQNVGVRHFEFVFGNSGPPTKFTCGPEVHRKFGVNRTCTFEDIVILQFLKYGLKRLFRPPKFTFLGVLTPKCYFSLLRPPKGTSLAGNTRFEPSLVAVRREVRPGRWAKNTKKYIKRVAQNVRPKLGCSARRPRWTDLYQILHVGSCPGFLS